MKNHVLASILTASVRIMVALLTLKITATYLGLSGIALLGQFQSLTAAALLIGGAANLQAIAAGTAAREQQGRRQWLATTIAVTFALSLTTAVFSVLILPLVSSALGLSPYSHLVMICLALLPASAIYWALTSFLGAVERPLQYASSQVVTQLVTALLLLLIVPVYSLPGAMAVPFLANAIGLAIVVRILKGTVAYPTLGEILAAGMSSDARRLASAGAMLLLAGLLPFVAQMIIRGSLLESSGQVAGAWQAVWKLSEVYLMPLTIGIQIYFLPRFARSFAMREDSSMLLWRGAACLSFVAFCIAGLFAFIGKDLVSIFLNQQFVGVAYLLPTQAIADAFRLMALLAGAWLISAGRWKAYLIYEVGFWGLFVCSAFLTLKDGASASAVVQEYLRACALFGLIGVALPLIRLRASS
jgi:PST family polysaccharide transporter